MKSLAWNISQNFEPKEQLNYVAMDLSLLKSYCSHNNSFRSTSRISFPSPLVKELHNLRACNELEIEVADNVFKSNF